MDSEKDYKLNVINEAGETFEIQVLDIATLEGSSKEYVIYLLTREIEDSNGDRNVYASYIEETEDQITLKTIENPEEWSKIQTIINSMFA